MLLASLLAGAGLGVIAALLLTPRMVEYIETVEIEAPAEKVYDAIRFQRDLMRWSAWPTETGSSCRVEGEDGAVGAQTVFLDKKGNRFGHQSVTRLEGGRAVNFSLESKGPPQVPALRFHLLPVGQTQTRVLLDFRNDLTPPFHVALRLFGIVDWTRRMHRKDLGGLKRFVERAEDYSGKPLTDVG